jgi:hypothetical protein
MVLEEEFSVSKFRDHRHQFVCIGGGHASVAINEFGHFKVFPAFEGAPVINSFRLGRRRFREKTIYLLEKDSTFITRYSYKLVNIDRRRKVNKRSPFKCGCRILVLSPGSLFAPAFGAGLGSGMTPSDSWASGSDSIGPAAGVCGGPGLRRAAVERGGQEKAFRVHGGLEKETGVCTRGKTVAEICKGLERVSSSLLTILEFWRITGAWF